MIRSRIIPRPAPPADRIVIRADVPDFDRSILSLSDHTQMPEDRVAHVKISDGRALAQAKGDETSERGGGYFGGFML